MINPFKTRKRKLSDQISRIKKKSEKLNNKLMEIIWKEIEPYTHKLEDISKAFYIINRQDDTSAKLDLFYKVRNINQDLESARPIEYKKGKKGEFRLYKEGHRATSEYGKVIHHITHIESVFVNPKTKTKCGKIGKFIRAKDYNRDGTKECTECFSV